MATTPPSRKRAAPKKAPTPGSKKPAAPKRKAAGSVTHANNAPSPKNPVSPAPQPPEGKQLVPGDTEGTVSDVPEDNPVAQLAPRIQRFVEEYLVDLNGTQAAIRAGYSARTANEQAAQLLAKLSVQRAVAAARKAQQERTQVSADKVVLGLWHIYSADARELVSVHVGCCRYCWGEGHRYQRTLSEYNRDRESFREGGKPPEDWEEQGGIGFSPLRDPHPDCPECHGDGSPRDVPRDTRYLSAATAALYAGVRRTKYGLDILTHDKLRAGDMLMKHLGAYEKDNNQKGDRLNDLLHAIGSGNGNGFQPQAVDPEKHKAPEKPSAFTPQANPAPEHDWRT